MRRGYRSDVPTAWRLLQDLARRFEDEHPSAAESVREDLEKPDGSGFRAVGTPAALVTTTDAAGSLISRTRLVKRNVIGSSRRT